MKATRNELMEESRNLFKKEAGKKLKITEKGTYMEETGKEFLE